jgi:hypothetical protein
MMELLCDGVFFSNLRPANFTRNFYDSSYMCAFECLILHEGDVEGGECTLCAFGRSAAGGLPFGQVRIITYACGVKRVERRLRRKSSLQDAINLHVL